MEQSNLYCNIIQIGHRASFLNENNVLSLLKCRRLLEGCAPRPLPREFVNTSYDCRYCICVMGVHPDPYLGNIWPPATIVYNVYMCYGIMGIYFTSVSMVFWLYFIWWCGLLCFLFYHTICTILSLMVFPLLNVNVLL